MTETELRDRAAHLFAPGGRLHEQYELAEGAELETLVPGVLWQTFVYPPGSSSSKVLRIYALDNGNAILERFWTNEVRTLHRIAARAHPLLPRLIGAGNAKELGLGYLLIEDPGFPLEGEHPRLAHLERDRVDALSSFANLVDAVAVLHAEGIVHRSLTPRVVLAPRSERGPLHVDGFQMSAFVAGLLRGTGASVDNGASAFVPAASTSAACLAPERLGSLLNGSTRALESFSCDVFSLGMIAATWFAGAPDDELAKAVIENGRHSESAHVKLVDSVHRRLREVELPAELRRLLEQMTAPSAANRIPSALEVSRTLGKLHGGLLAQLQVASDAVQPKPRVVYFLQETIKHLYEDGLGRTSPQEPDEQEYAELVAADLVGGSMVWSPHGFEPWVRHGDRQAAARARVVLLGKRYAYFCQYLDESRREEDTRILLVKYPCALHKVRELLDAPRKQPLPPVQALFFDPNGARRRPISADAPSWRPAVEQIRFDAGQEAGSPVAATARWLVGYQDGLLAAQDFAYERVGAPGADQHEGASLPIVLRSLGPARTGIADDRGAAFMELLRREKLVDPMGDCFESVAEEAFEAGDSAAFVVTDSTGKEVGVVLTFDERLDGDTVRFKPVEGDLRIPARGRIGPDDRATRISLERQEIACRDLADRHDLLAQLRQPRGIRLETAPSAEVGGSSLAQTAPEAAALVRRIVEEEPLFALQGPPGTGKTFVASHVVKEVLRLDPLSRLLVSAQSNPATDNILEALDKLLPEDAAARPLIIRHTSQEARGKLSSRAGRFTLDEQVVEARNRIAEQPGITGPLAPLRKEWRRLAKAHDLDAEIFSRLPRAANVVFATCIGAGTEVEALKAGPGFDWVVIEEAAHAWLSEIAVPLVQGDRWLLIGDHKQLPAHGADDVERVFRRDLEEQVTADATDSIPSESWLPYLAHFRHLMEVAIPSGHWTSPRARLDVQRRMHPDIGNLISDAYYDGELKTHDDAKREHGLRGGGLGFLSKTALAWLDTSDYGEDAEETGYINRLEIHLIRTLLGRIPSFPTSPGSKIPPLAILSPYKRQLLRLQKEARNNADARDEVFRTVDSVQGREAEVVIVSLVRNNSLGEVGKALGFLRAPERANVMFSRARRLLLIVGSLKHFARFPGTHWGRVIDYVKSDPDRFIVDPKSTLNFTWRRS